MFKKENGKGKKRLHSCTPAEKQEGVTSAHVVVPRKNRMSRKKSKTRPPGHVKGGKEGGNLPVEN